MACGERQVNEYKRIRFEQSYKVPENSNIDDPTAKFEDEILFIIIPKVTKAQKEPHPEITNVPEAVQEEKGNELNNVVDKEVPQAVLKKEEEEAKGNDQITDAAANGSRHESDSHNHHGNEELSDEESEEEDDDTVEEEKTTTEEEDFHDPKMENQSSLMEELGKKLKKNKGILITAVLAFSLGVIVSQKFQPNE